MKNKTLVLVFLTSFIILGQKKVDNIQLQTNVHPILATSAFDLLLMQYPELGCTEMYEHLGSIYDTGGPWSREKITTGSYREDLEAVVYMYEWPYETMSHFWNADAGDNSKFQLPVLVGNYYKNAYQKARVYIYGSDTEGHKGIYINGNALANESVCVPLDRDGLFISYNSLFDFYNTGTYYVEGFQLFGFNFWTTCGPFTLSKDKRDFIVWEILGRVTHLLGDMGVPAHVHNDEHPIWDGYEDGYMDNVMASNYDEYLAYQQGGLIDVHSKYDPLRYLFYTTNQVTDFFASDDETGDENYSASYGSDTYTELQSIISILHSIFGTPPPIPIVMDSAIASHAYITSMRAIAGLFHWFALETNQFTMVTTSGTLQTDETWGNVVLTGDVFVPTGKILELCNGTVNLNNHYIKSTGGIIIQESNTTIDGLKAYLKQGSTLKGYFSSFSSALSNVVNGQTVELLANTTYTGNISISNKNIILQGQSNTSTYINGNITLTNSDSDIKLLKTKLISANYSDVEINNVRADRFTTYSEDAMITNSIFSPGQAPNQITNCVSTLSYNTITDALVGAYLTSNSYGMIAYNYFCGNDMDVLSYSGSYANIHDNTYSFSPYSSCGGSVTVYGNISYCSANKVVINDYSIESTDNPEKDLKKIDNDYGITLEKVLDDKKANDIVDMSIYSADFNTLIDSYKAFLEKYPNSKEAPTAVFRTVHCYQQQDDFKGLFEFISGLLTDKKFDGIKPAINRHLIDYYVNEGNPLKGIEIADEIISVLEKNYDLYCELLFEKGIIYKYLLEKPSDAEKMFLIIVQEYPENKIYGYAERELDDMGVQFEKGSLSNLVAEDNLFKVECFPNPFNPSTTISYSLPQVSNVKITIYDIIGREVKTLNINSQKVGTHEFEWTADPGLASGIYLLNFIANSTESKSCSFIKTMKLMLVK